MFSRRLTRAHPATCTFSGAGNTYSGTSMHQGLRLVDNLIHLTNSRYCLTPRICGLISINSAACSSGYRQAASW